MTTLSELAQQLAAWATTAAAWRRIDLSAGKEAALRGYSSGAALVAAVHSSGGATPEEVLVALVRQAQRSRAPVWSALLVVASARWLARLARRFEKQTGSLEDSESLVVTALLTIVCSVRASHRVSRVWLKLQTQRQVIAWLRNQGLLEGGAADERRLRRRPAPGRARHRVRRLTDVCGQVAA